jgi:iron complex outermembrane receptor protein
MGGSHHRSVDIATVVSRVLRAASICTPVALIGAPVTLSEASEFNALAADIPAQPLAQALAAFRRQTGLQLIYVSSVISNQRSQGVAAGLNADEALDRLLQGTGLRFEHLTPRSIRIFAGVVAPQRTTPRVLMGEVRDEVLITASRSAEKLQDVPITIQSMTGYQLNQLNVTTAYDLLKYTTNVTYSGNGPGTGNIFMRGLGGYGSGNQSQSTTAPFPNVALYLDDQSMQFPARNNDVYLVDMGRVEVLEGPQGTLFGGGAQAGAIRYITNKPQLERASGELNAGYGGTAGGDPNTNLNAILNVPLIDNVFGLRGVIFSDTRGGYIDNVPGTIGFHPGTPPYDVGGKPTADNGLNQGNNLNKVTYTGARLSARWQINDNWDALLQQNYQNMEADGYFYAYPTSTDGHPLGRYQITAFAPAYTKDDYESTAWTLNGKIADLLSMVYTGSYRVRHIDGQQDYANYLRSAAGFFYACIGTGAGYFNQANFPNQLAGHKLQCSASVGNWRDQVRNTHQSHELRFTTKADNRIRGLAGFYWEKFVIDDNMNFNYLGIPQCDQANLNRALNSPDGSADCLSAVGPVPGAFATDPSLRTNADTAFGEDVQRGYKQKAFFTSIDVDVIPRLLTASGGIRFYHYDEFEEGSEYYSATTSGSFSPSGQGLVVNHLNGQCTAAGLCGFPINLSRNESGHSWRGNLTWLVTADVMSYFTYSEGFRPGGFNRTGSLPGQPPVLQGLAPYSGPNTNQYARSTGYNSDNLINNEVGFKSEFLDHHVLFNLAAYYMKWENSQQALFDPVNLGNNTFNVNGSSYTVKGFEVQFVARITDELTLHGSSSVNTSSQSSTPCLTSVGADPNATGTANNPTPKGHCITQVNGAPYTNPFGQRGARPAFSPPWIFNLLARYDWTAGAYRRFAWVGASHIAAMSNEPANFPDGNAPGENPPTGWPSTTLLRYQIPAYTTYDGGLGVAKDNWTAQIQGNNLTNAYGPTKISSDQFIKSEIPLRPRVITFLVGYRF